MNEVFKSDFLSNVHGFLNKIVAVDKQADGQVGNIFKDKELSGLYSNYLNDKDGGDKNQEGLLLFANIFAKDAKDGQVDFKIDNLPLLEQSTDKSIANLDLSSYNTVFKTEEQEQISSFLQNPAEIQKSGQNPIDIFITIMNYLKSAQNSGNYQKQNTGYVPQLSSQGKVDLSGQELTGWNDKSYGETGINKGQPIDNKYNKTPENIRTIVDKVAKEEGLDPNLLMAIIKQESNFKSDAKSHCGAQGLMQLMPETAKETAKELGIQNYDINDPETNIKLGARYFKKMLKMFNGDVKLALAAYNSGPGNVKKAGNNVPKIAETQGYVKNILNNYQGHS